MNLMASNAIERRPATSKPSTPSGSETKQDTAALDPRVKPSLRLYIYFCLLAVAVSAGVARLDRHWRAHNGPSFDPAAFRHSVLWMAPFFSGGGYSSEAISYVMSMKRGVFNLAIRHHGDAENRNFWTGLPLATRKTLISLSSTHVDVRDAVVVCHSEPGAWHPPLYLTPPCPPSGSRPLYLIGRTMFETDSVTPHHVDRCNKMDEIWVPTQFHVHTFTRAGVSPEKLVKVVQPVDTDFFSPAHVQPLKLPATNPLLGENPSSHPFVFLSVFKWEHRKGWDVLLSAYLREFSGDDDVALYLLTNRYHFDGDFASVVKEFVMSSSISEPRSGWARVHLLDEHVPQSHLPSLYKAASCFVLPSRGEGWGRPHVEAMAMELPVIATNWSGMTEYMTEGNSYPLEVDRMVEVVEGPFKGHLWAEPSMSHLMRLMRHVVVHREEARAKGKVARADMVTKFAPEVVGRVVVEQLLRIQAKLHSRTSAHQPSVTSR